MVRQLGLPLTVPRSRNRITNKSRLKIYKGDIDAEAYIPEEDDEKTRLLQSVAGVDKEDANVGSRL
jgi:enhancer of polycomb-like protein